MSFNFGIPGQVRRVLSGVGMGNGNRFNAEDEIRKCAERLAADAEVVAIMNMPGWKRILGEFEGIIVLQWDTLKTLSLDTKKNEDAIQARRDLIQVFEIFLETMKLPAERHNITAERQKQLLKRQTQERHSNVVP